MSTLHGYDGFTSEDIVEFKNTVETKGWEVFRKLLDAAQNKQGRYALEKPDDVYLCSGAATMCKDLLFITPDTVLGDFEAACKEEDAAKA